jgi:hypothetical protein
MFLSFFTGPPDKLAEGLIFSTIKKTASGLKAGILSARGHFFSLLAL